ncbi:MAG: vWA domain-containing protein [Candidatus Dormibacteria bacterium]
MAAERQPKHRFSAWDGTQDPFGPDVDEIFAQLSEDVFHGWDFDTALQRMLNSGLRDRDGQRRAGLEEMMERLRRRRQQQLERYNLDSVFSDITEKLDRVISQERRGIQERLDAAPKDHTRRLLDRVAQRRGEQLDALPAEAGTAIRALRDYEFMDGRAEQQFQQLLEEIRRNVVDAHFKEMTASMQAMSKEDMAQLGEMAKDLNALLRQRLDGVSEAQLQRNYEGFLRRWGHLFPNAPEDLEAFLAQLMQQMARMDSLLQSLSPEMRRELESVISSVFDDPELQATLTELAGSLDLLAPGRGLGQQHNFFGDQEVSMDEAMRLMEGLQTIDAAESGLRGLGRGDELDDQLREQLRGLLGEDALRSVEQMEQIMREFEKRGLMERNPRGTQLTARGMRRIGEKALGDLFARLSKDRFGEHALPRHGHSGERADDSKPYEFGDTFDLDVESTVMNALRREGGAPQQQSTRALPRLQAGDFEVHRSEALTRCSTVLMLDMSRSMPLRGYFYAAKKVALALDSLIRSQYPRDRLAIVGFSDYAREIASPELSHLSVNEYVYGTNLQHGLILARRILARSHAENKQIIIVSDGEPTAHIEDGRAVFFYPPLPETFAKTLIEVKRCTRENIVINTFMLESNHHLMRFVNQMTRLNRGRTFFIDPDRLGDYVLVDYVKSRAGSAA